jgi:hypothetical protein
VRLSIEGGALAFSRLERSWPTKAVMSSSAFALRLSRRLLNALRVVEEIDNTAK